KIPFLKGIRIKHMTFSCSVFDVDDDNIPDQFRNGYTFLAADEQVSQQDSSQHECLLINNNCFLMLNFLFILIAMI
ncbi:hypothetical protein, partial [Mycobacterium tuberculosis]